jgi:hypothetical protein
MGDRGCGTRNGFDRALSSHLWFGVQLFLWDYCGEKLFSSLFLPPVVGCPSRSSVSEEHLEGPSTCLSRFS